MRECLEEGIVQAYMDGELSPDAARRVEAHASRCESCTALLAEADSELQLLATAFEPELSLPVPSERLRERLEAAIGTLPLQDNSAQRASRPSLKAWLTSLVSGFDFAPRHAAGFASIIAVLLFTALLLTVATRRQEQPYSTAHVALDGPNFVSSFVVRPTENVASIQKPVDDGGSIVRKVNDANRVSAKSRLRVRTTPNVEASAGGNTEAVAERQLLPGEESYLKTIAALTSIIDANGESALKPSLRADYERNLALVNQAIDATRRVARRNPKDPDATEFLYSSYQSKIDLLSTVAEQGQMVAVAR